MPSELFVGLGELARVAVETGNFNVQLKLSKAGTYRRTRRTVFGGPCFYHSARVFSVNPWNFQHAASRWLHDKIGLKSIAKRQRKNCSRSDLISLVREIGRHAASHRTFPLGEEGVEQYAQQTHPKKAERLAALTILRKDGKIYDSSPWIFNRFGRKTDVEAKQKPEEMMKGRVRPDDPDKPPRMIGNLGPFAVLQGGAAVDEVKSSFSAGAPSRKDGCWVLNGSRFKFHKSINMKDLFEMYNDDLSEGPRWDEHSDDSLLAVPTLDAGPYGTNRILFEFDFEMCDGSIGPSVIQLYRHFAPSGRESEWDSSISQLRHTACFGKGEDRIRLKPRSYVMYSGWAGTTLVDTLAGLVVFRHVMRGWKKMTTRQTIDFVMSRIQTSGFKLTTKVVRRYPQATFVKTFPCLGADGKYYPTVCLGTMLRTYGQKRYDLPGRGDIDRRAQAYNAGVAMATKHWGNHCINRALQTRFKDVAPCKVDFESYLLREISGGYDVSLCTTSLSERYSEVGVTDSYLEMYARMIATCKSRSYYDMREIFLYDYGYPITDYMSQLEFEDPCPLDDPR